jgi:hypothetical protein
VWNKLRINTSVKGGIYMAKMIEQHIVIKLSQLIKDTEQAGQPADHDVIASLEAVVQELVGTKVLVEVTSE